LFVISFKPRIFFGFWGLNKIWKFSQDLLSQTPIKFYIFLNKIKEKIIRKSESNLSGKFKVKVIDKASIRRRIFCEIYFCRFCSIFNVIGYCY